MQGDPTPGQRLRPVLGGRLPEPVHDGVRHDLTCAPGLREYLRDRRPRQHGLPVPGREPPPRGY